MSVSNFDPSKDSAAPTKTAAAITSGAGPGASQDSATRGISVTPAAQQHITVQLESSGASQVRLGVKESGCNGFMYTLDFVDRPQAEDLQIDVTPALQLVVSQEDIAMVGGTEIDLVTEGLNSALRFKNPNAESHCGCGESFSVAAAQS